MDMVFLVGAIVLVLAVVLSVLLKEVPLRRLSGLQAAQSEASGAAAAPVPPEIATGTESASAVPAGGRHARPEPEESEEPDESEDQLDTPLTPSRRG